MLVRRHGIWHVFQSMCGKGQWWWWWWCVGTGTGVVGRYTGEACRQCGVKWWWVISTSMSLSNCLSFLGTRKASWKGPVCMHMGEVAGRGAGSLLLLLLLLAVQAGKACYRCVPPSLPLPPTQAHPPSSQSPPPWAISLLASLHCLPHFPR